MGYASVSILAVAAASVVVLSARGELACEVPGVDLVVGEITAPVKWGSLDGHTAYSFGSVVCNLGLDPAEWDGLTAHHPVIVQQLHRLDAQGLHPLGISWALHQPVPLQNVLCCPACDPDPTLESLGGGCSNPNSAGTHGAQGGGPISGLGPRSQVNPATGALVHPFTDSTEPLTVLRERMHVAASALDPARHPDARWFVEMTVVSAPDAQAGNQGNNASVREVLVGPPAGGEYPLLVTGPTFRGATILEQWAAIDPSVIAVAIDVPEDGRIVVAGRAVPTGRGTHRYEYAVENLASARAIGGVMVPTGVGAAPFAFAFRDVAHHSGEPWEGADWPPVSGEDFVRWRTEAFAVNPNANAIRWGTTYAFAFESAEAPELGAVVIELFAPGAAVDVTAILPVPGAACAPDLDDDGEVAFADLVALLAAWGPCGAPGCPGDLDGDAAVGFSDLLALLAAWGPCAAP